MQVQSLFLTYYDLLLNLPDSELVSMVAPEVVLSAVVVVARLLSTVDGTVVVISSGELDDVVAVVEGITLGLDDDKAEEEGIFPTLVVVDELL